MKYIPYFKPHNPIFASCIAICMASPLFNTPSNIPSTLNIHSLKPKTPSNYHVKPKITNFTKNQQDNKSYFTNLSTFTRNGQIQEALSILSHMNNNGIQIGPEFYVELLQGCVSEKSLFLGQQIHGLIIKKGDIYAKNEYIETKLIIFYAKCDDLVNVYKLFDRLLCKNLFSWAAIIGLNSRLGFNETALLGYCEILENGIFPDNFVIPNVLKSCGAKKCVLFGKGIHGYVIKMGFENCVYVASSLVDMYGKCEVLEDAKKVFDGMIERNDVVWNSMIVSYLQNGMNEEAMQLFYDMRFEGVEPTRVTISSLLSASANLGVLEEGRQGHALAVLYGLELGTILGSSFINFYAKVGLVEEAELVFKAMVEKDVVTWNLMISCYVQHGLIENAVHMCGLMRLRGLKFDCVTMASLFSACSKNDDVKLGKMGHCYCIRHNVVLDAVVIANMVDMYAKGGDLVYARRVFDSSSEKDIIVWNTLLAAYAELGLSEEALNLFYEMQLQGFHPNVISWNSLLSAFLRNHQVDEAKRMFSQMSIAGVEPNVVTWTTLLTGLVQNGFGFEAILLFTQMQEAGVKPNAVSLTALLSACISITSLILGKAIHGYLIKRWQQFSAEILTSLVDMYSKCGSVADAVTVFTMTSEKNLAVYNAMISAYGLHSQARKALMLYKKMSVENIEPDDVTFTSILSACSHEGLVDQGVRVFADIMSVYNKKPTMEHYSCLVTLFSRCDSLDKAIKLILTMPFKPDEQIFGSILSACRERGEIELGEYISKYLFQLEQNTAANYVALSNLYAASGQWSESSKLRNLMKSRGLKKSPGCSWVQIGSECHVFSAGDRSHPQKEEIFTTLALLQKEMRMKHDDFSLEIYSS